VGDGSTLRVMDNDGHQTRTAAFKLVGGGQAPRFVVHLQPEDGGQGSILVERFFREVTEVKRIRRGVSRRCPGSGSRPDRGVPWPSTTPPERRISGTASPPPDLILRSVE